MYVRRGILGFDGEKYSKKYEHRTPRKQWVKLNFSTAGLCRASQWVESLECMQPQRPLQCLFKCLNHIPTSRRVPPPTSQMRGTYEQVRRGPHSCGSYYLLSQGRHDLHSLRKQLRYSSSYNYVTKVSANPLNHQYPNYHHITSNTNFLINELSV